LLMLKAFLHPAASACSTAIMLPSLESFFLSSVCGWLQLDALDISYSLNSMPTSLADTLTRLILNQERHVSAPTNAATAASVPLSQHDVSSTRCSYHVLPNNIQVCQRWQLLMSAASSNAPSCFRFAASVQACALALCFPSVVPGNITKPAASFAIDAVKLLLASDPPYIDEKSEQQISELCSSWLNLVYDTSSQAAATSSEQLVDADSLLHSSSQTLLSLPRLNIIYEKPFSQADLLHAPVKSSSLALSPVSTGAHSAFWAQCASDVVLQLLQVAAPDDGVTCGCLQACRLFLLQHSRMSGIVLGAMNAFAFERFASPPDMLHDLVAAVSGSAAAAAISARKAVEMPQMSPAKASDNRSKLPDAGARALANVLSCRRRIIGSCRDVAPVFGPVEEVASTRELIRSIALLPALADPCIIAAGANILAEIKLSPKGCLAARSVAAPSPKSLESAVSSGLKKLGNSLFAKVFQSPPCLICSSFAAQVYAIGSPAPAPTLFVDDSSSDDLTMISSSSWNCVGCHPTFPMYDTARALCLQF
jgi:hypothetical protein